MPPSFWLIHRDDVQRRAAQLVQNLYRTRIRREQRRRRFIHLWEAQCWQVSRYVH